MSDATSAVSSGMEVPCGTLGGGTTEDKKRPSGGVCDNTGNPLGLTTTQGLGDRVMATSILPHSRSAMRTRCECAQDHAELFSTTVDRSGDCWEWTGPVNPDGYGREYHNRHTWMAHRLAYIAFKGEIPVGLVVDHLCGNRRCVNPEHLEAVTDRVNILRGTGMAAINARKELCKRGHPLSPKGPNQRTCITCRNAAQRTVKPMEDDDPRHGTANGYANRKCRCDSCRAAWAAHIAQRRAKRRREQLQADFTTAQS